MQIWVVVIEGWLSSSAQSIYLNEGDQMRRRLEMERRTRPSLGEPGKLREVLMVLVFILPSSVDGGWQSASYSEDSQILSPSRKPQQVLNSSLCPRLHLRQSGQLPRGGGSQFLAGTSSILTAHADPQHPNSANYGDLSSLCCYPYSIITDFCTNESLGLYSPHHYSFIAL